MAISNWHPLIIGHVRELASLRRELAEIQKAILQTRSEVAANGSDTKWRQDSAMAYHTRGLREEEVDVATSIKLHEDAVTIIRMFVEMDIAHDAALEPPPDLD